jgi:hypothetical protein
VENIVHKTMNVTPPNAVDSSHAGETGDVLT